MSNSTLEKTEEADIYLPGVAARMAKESGSVEELSTKLESYAFSNRKITREFVRFACRELMRSAKISIRNSVASEYSLKALQDPNNPARNRYLSSIGSALELYDMPLPLLSKKLGDATANDLSDVKDYYLGRAETFSRRGGAFRRLQEALVRSNKETVRDAFTVEQLKKILGDIGEDE